MASQLDSWKRQHAAGEKLLGKVLLKFFLAEDARVRDALGGTLTPAAVAQAVHESSERDAMLKAISPTLLGMMGTGAATVLKQSRPRAKKDFDPDELASFTLPQRVINAIGATFGELEKQDFWLGIQQTYVASITDLLTSGIEDGLSGPKLAKLLRETMPGMSKVRSAAIARTETTAAYAAGHQASYDALADEGLTGKVWLAVRDKDTRETHAELDGITVAAGEDFDVGGNDAPWPAHWSLPAEERVNCRCTTTAEFE
ncbi:MAG: phage minor head protein [Pirellulaceae bacterium]|nr:phage minor head protein [Pirellulaceae bacterium]